MNAAKQEQLSAFMDDEAGASRDTAAEEWLRDPELLKTWGRYHLISDCLKRNMPPRLDQTLASRVARSLEREPAMVAPTRASPALLKPVTGFAIAASVAALAIFGIQQQQTDAPTGAPPLQAGPGNAGGGNVMAPARQVSSGRGAARTGPAGKDCETVQDDRPATAAAPTGEGSPEAGCQ